MPSTTDFANSSITHNSGTHLIEIGWIVAGRLDDPDRQAFTRARHHLLTYVQQTFAEFTWRMPMVHREELVRLRFQYKDQPFGGRPYLAKISRRVPSSGGTSLSLAPISSANTAIG